MGWSFRRSMNFGGVRLNFSKSGVGASVGVRGLRYGVSPNGRRYVRCGMDGIYYQKTLGSSRGGRSAGVQRSTFPGTVTSPQQPFGNGDPSTIVDSSSADFVAELQKRLKTPPWYFLGLIPGCIVMAPAIPTHSELTACIALVLMFIGFIGAHVVYRAKTATEVHYHLDPGYQKSFDGFVAGFEHLRQSRSIWIIEGRSGVQNAKYHSGATSSVTRGDLRASFGVPSFLHCNLRLPMLEGKRQSLYFLPDMVLVVQGSKIGAVSFSNMSVAGNPVTFHESDVPPSDSQVVGTTWQYVNKKGGPDRRFANNSQIALVRYAQVNFMSKTGLDEEIQVSNVPAAQAFVYAANTMAQAVASGNPHRTIRP